MRRSWLVYSLVAGAALLVSTLRVDAHHAFSAQYDRNKPITLTGTMTEMEWMNPHIYFYIDVEDEETGEVTNWAIEGGAPNGLYRRGWRKDSIKTGEQVTVEGWLAKDGSNAVNADSVIGPEGRRLFAGTSNPEAEDSEP